MAGFSGIEAVLLVAQALFGIQSAIYLLAAAVCVNAVVKLVGTFVLYRISKE